MPNLDNPAARLHALLRHFGDAPGDISVQAAWAGTLDVPENEVHLHLGAVGVLLMHVQRAAEEADDPDDPTWTQLPGYLAALGGCIFPTQVPLTHAAKELRPDPTSIQIPKSLAFGLRVQDDGRIPDDDELARLIEQVQTPMTEVGKADLPPAVRRGLLDRLAEMLEALNHLDIGGPDAAKRAAESLALAAMVQEVAQPETKSLMQRLKMTAKATIAAVIVVGSASNSLLALDKIIDVPAIEQPKPPPQLMPPREAAGPDH